MKQFLALHVNNALLIVDHLRQLARSLMRTSDDLPHLCWYIGKTLNGEDPPAFQLHKRMGDTWWHFSQTWKDE
eukprot:1694080-Alexandrium_andersonii.AAC.1